MMVQIASNFPAHARAASTWLTDAYHSAAVCRRLRACARTSRALIFLAAVGDVAAQPLRAYHSASVCVRARTPAGMYVRARAAGIPEERRLPSLARALSPRTPARSIAAGGERVPDADKQAGWQASKQARQTG